MLDPAPFKRALGALALALGATVAAPPQAGAAIVTYSFTGTASFISGGLTTPSVGDALSGSFSVDDSVAALAGSNTVTAVFNALTSMSFSLGGSLSGSTTGAPEVQIGNQGAEGAANETTDRYATLSRASDGLVGGPLDGFALDTFGIRMDDSTGTVFGPANGPLPTAFSLSDFDSSAFFIFLSDGQFISGNLTSLAAVTVPEPAALALLGAGLLGLVMVRRRPA